MSWQPVRWAGFALVLWACVTSGVQAQSSPAIETTFVPATAQLAIVAFPQRALTSRDLEFYPIEVMSAATLKEAGFDLLQLAQVTLVGEATEHAKKTRGGAVLRFSQPIAKDRALAGLSKLEGHGERPLIKTPYGKGEYFKVEGAEIVVAAPSDRVLLCASDENWMKLMLDAAQPPAGKPSRIVSLLAQLDSQADIAGVFDVSAVADEISQELNEKPIPPEYAKFKQVPQLLSAVSGAMSIRAGLKDRLTLQAKDEAAAKELDALIPAALELARQQVLAEVSKQPTNTATEKALVRYLERVSTEIATALRPKRSGVELTVEKVSGGSGMTEIAVLNALLLPAVQRVRDAARRAEAVREAQEQ